MQKQSESTSAQNLSRGLPIEEAWCTRAAKGHSESQYTNRSSASPVWGGMVYQGWGPTDWKSGTAVPAGKAGAPGGAYISDVGPAEPSQVWHSHSFDAMLDVCNRHAQQRVVRIQMNAHAGDQKSRGRRSGAPGGVYMSDVGPAETSQSWH